MAKLTILEFPDPRLRTRASPVETVDDELNTLIDDMFETMYAAPGIGLAATQVDVHKRLLVVDVSSDNSEPNALINPEIIEMDGETVSEEGCLSVPGMTGLVPRANHIIYRGATLDGETFEREARGFHARVVQHECDHLDGILYPQRMTDLANLMFESEMRHYVGADDEEADEDGEDDRA